MIYLAEVKKLNKGFIGGVSAELKLLACQRNDQTWSTVPGEEIVSCESIDRSGEGALLLVNLSENRQIQGKPESAGPKLVRWLQELTNKSDKTSSEWAKIEQWKQSLTYQSQTLSRREMEIEARLEQLEQMEQEFERLDHQRQDLQTDWAGQNPFGGEAEGNNVVHNNSSGQATASALLDVLGDPHVFREKLMQGLAAIDLIQNQYQDTALANRRQVQALLAQTSQRQKQLLTKIEEMHTSSVVDLEALENQPLGELEGEVDTLREDLERRMAFVSEQEEELTLQSQAVAELKDRLQHASEFERLSLEGELADEQERKRMLDETLVGQRRTLREQQEIYHQHLQVLSRRQGKADVADEWSGVNLDPVLSELKQQHLQTLAEYQKVSDEIHVLQEALDNGRFTSALGGPAEEFHAALNRIHQQFEAIESLLEGIPETAEMSLS